jgi:hypothetical protein
VAATRCFVEHLLYLPGRDVKRLHGVDQCHAVVLAPSQKLCHSATVAAAHVRIVDYELSGQKTPWSRSGLARRMLR